MHAFLRCQGCEARPAHPACLYPSKPKTRRGGLSRVSARAAGIRVTPGFQHTREHERTKGVGARAGMVGRVDGNREAAKTFELAKVASVRVERRILRRAFRMSSSDLPSSLGIELSEGSTNNPLRSRRDRWSRLTGPSAVSPFFAVSRFRQDSAHNRSLAAPTDAFRPFVFSCACRCSPVPESAHATCRTLGPSGDSPHARPSGSRPR